MLGHLRCPPHRVHVCFALGREPLNPGEEGCVISRLVPIREKPAITFRCSTLCQGVKAPSQTFSKALLAMQYGTRNNRAQP